MQLAFGLIEMTWMCQEPISLEWKRPEPIKMKRQEPFKIKRMCQDS